MAILIKDVDIPKCCNECRFKYAVKCRTYTGFHHRDTERAAKCPLIKVADVRESLQEVPTADYPHLRWWDMSIDDLIYVCEELSNQIDECDTVNKLLLPLALKKGEQT